MSAIQQLSQGLDDGVCLGQSSTDKVSMYGITPTVQLAVGAAVATTDLTTTGILAVVNAYNTLITQLKLVGIVKT